MHGVGKALSRAESAVSQLSLLTTLQTCNLLSCRAQWIPTAASLSITLSSLGICGFVQGSLQAALLAEASSLPLVYTQAVIAGCAASGTSPDSICIQHTPERRVCAASAAAAGLVSGEACARMHLPRAILARTDGSSTLLSRPAPGHGTQSVILIAGDWFHKLRRTTLSHVSVHVPLLAGVTSSR